MASNKPKSVDLSVPRVLLWDLENTPSLGYVWGKYDQTVNAFKEDWYILSFAYKWLDESTTHVVALPDFPNYKRNKKDDKQLCLKLRDILDQADITVAHNGDKFDMKKAMARFLVHGIDPPSPSRQVDTLKIARSVAMFTSNKLGDLGEFLGHGGKEETGGFETWLGCMEGDMKAWRTMKKYNKADVELLEKVYLSFVPFTKTHPNMALLSGRPNACPRCGAQDSLTKRGTAYSATSLLYMRYQCNVCHGYCSSRLAMPKEEASRPNTKVP